MLWEFWTGLALIGFVVAVVTLHGAAAVGAALLLAGCMWHWAGVCR